jgi:hypothetical protein
MREQHPPARRPPAARADPTREASSMTEPSPQHDAEAGQTEPEQPDPQQTDAFDDLDRRPVAEHVAIFEAEHTRLRDELSTIDQL